MRAGQLSHPRLDLPCLRQDSSLLAVTPLTCHPRSESSSPKLEWPGLMFRQEVQAIGLSIEQGTSLVPNDGRFHVVVDGNVVFSSKAKSTALTRYRSLRDELLQKAGIEQKPVDPEETRRRERQFYDFQAVMSESMRQRAINAKRKGGKGGSGGV